MKKVVVFGLAGSGKTFLSSMLSQVLRVEHHDLDEVLFTTGGALPMADFRTRVSAITEGEGWVVDGNYSKLADITWHRADTVIWLDYPLPVLLRRLIARGVRRRTGWELIPKRLQHRRIPVKRRSLLLTTIRKHLRNRERYAHQMIETADMGIRVLRFRTPRETATWLAQGIERDGRFRIQAPSST